jgi:hypothetical protein
VYSLLGISETHVSISITPDKPDDDQYESVFIDTAVKLACSKEDAVYLLPHAGVGYSRKNSRLPTWVPDWEAESLRPTNIISIHLRPGRKWFGRALITKESKYEFCASGDPTSSDRKLSFTVLPHLQLQVTAIRIDCITELTSMYLNYRNDPIYHSNWLYDAENCFKNMPDAEGTYRDAFWRTLVMDGTFNTRPCPNHWSAVYQSWRRLSPSARVNLDSSKLATLTAVFGPEYFQDREYPKQDWEGEVGAYSSRFIDSCSGRRFCSTEKKRIGLTAPKTHPGDVVCLIIGLQVPYVLRWCSLRKGYRLVGECYIHGVMYGEMVDEASIEELTIV